MGNLLNRKTSALMILLALFMMPLLAQQRPPGGGPGGGQGRGQMSEEDIKNRVETLAETLECTDEQKEQLTEYEINRHRKMQTERAKWQSGGDFDREAFRASMQKQRELRDAKYKEILNESQMAKYNQLMEERRQARQQRWDESQERQDGRRQRGRGRN